MIKLKVKYSVVLDGEKVILEGIHSLPDEIEKDLVIKGFAEEVSEEDVAPKELIKAKKMSLVDGKLTEKELVKKLNTSSSDDGKITLESLLAMTEEEIDALAIEKGITLSCKKQDTKANELFKALEA